MRTILIWLGKGMLWLGTLSVFLLLLAWWQFRASLPLLVGAEVVSGITANVRIDRDRQGLATIHGQNRTDLAFATGFLHAQERFFQMDLLRRRASGELSELFGAAAIKIDRAARVHRFRALARRVVNRLAAGNRLILRAYSRGVNAGLKSLDARPFEYFLLRQSPRAWRVEDSLLVVYSMYFTLQDDNGEGEWQRMLLARSLPHDVVRFLLPRGTRWDAPIEGGALLPAGCRDAGCLPDFTALRVSALTNGHTVVGVPSLARATNQTLVSAWRGSQERYRDTLAALIPHADEALPGPIYGSNNWAVGGALTGHRGAILANDMHLGLSVPNTWFRLRLRMQGLDVSGLSLPGTPLIVAGSNGSVAWGFTNAYGDWGDLIALEINPRNSNQYRTPAGYRNFKRFNEIIHVQGAQDELLRVRQTQWGPVLRSLDGISYAFKWVAQEPEGLNLGLLKMERTRSVAAALVSARTIALPAQNAILADRYGSVAWTIFGAMPRKRAGDYTVPEDWSNGQFGWTGWVQGAARPSIVNPPGARLWTANARVVAGSYLQQIGDGGYALGARAGQIRDDLRALKHRVRERDLLQIQLDDRALFLRHWQVQLSRVLAASNDPALFPFRNPVRDWQERAAVTSVGYRLVRSYRLALARIIFDRITASCKRAYPDCNYFRATRQWEGPLWALVGAEPEALLDRQTPSWQALYESAAHTAWKAVINGRVKLSHYSWGDRNTAAIRHPLSRFVPLLGRLTDMPPDQLPGDSNMPRVAAPAFGQSERMVVGPGHEQEGILHMPTSQSGHPLSPYYGVGHRDWVSGKASPFLPGKTRWSLILTPESKH